MREDLRITRLKSEQCNYARFNEERSEYIILPMSVDYSVIARITYEAISAFK